jgi:transcriptional regulator with XRE-family HTH domain
MAEIKDRLYDLRNKNGLNRVEMAQRLGLNKSSITRFENGETKPSLDLMIKIANEFGVTLDWLAGFDTEIAMEYEMLIKECLNHGISSEKLKRAIDLLRD